MTRHRHHGALASTRAGVVAGLFAAALGTGAASAQSYEVWAVDQGTGVVHVLDPSLAEVGRIDLAGQGVKTPHMIDFTSDGAYAVIAAPGSGDVTVIRTADRTVVANVKTGPGSHMASFTPDDRAILVDVIGSGDVPKDGKLVELTFDRQNETVAPGRSLTIAEDPLVQAKADRFGDGGAVCHDYGPDGRHAFVTLGPGLKDGGLVVLDLQSFQLAAAFSPDELKVNCGTFLSPDGKHFFVNGGSAEVGVWYALDTATFQVVKQGETGGLDAHGVWATPDGRELWMVNRVTSNGIVIDPATLEVVGELPNVGKTPDIIAMSPDNQYAFITLRGPNPITAAHVAKGETPGFAVLNIADRSLVKIVQPAEGNEKSDFHGIGVRTIQ